MSKKITNVKVEYLKEITTTIKVEQLRGRTIVVGVE